jgi:hypothetical protein
VLFKQKDNQNDVNFRPTNFLNIFWTQIYIFLHMNNCDHWLEHFKN